MRLGDLDTLKAEFTGNFGRELWHYTGIWAMIDVAPTIDAVPVVRCKDCKWSAYRKSPFGVQTFTCQLLCADIKPDDFCSYGERKGGEDDGENETN